MANEAVKQALAHAHKGDLDGALMALLQGIGEEVKKTLPPKEVAKKASMEAKQQELAHALVLCTHEAQRFVAQVLGLE